MKNYRLVILLAIPILLLAAGCTPECSAEEILTFNTLPQSPADGAVVSYDNPGTFQWTHQESCLPSKYRITFVQGTFHQSYSTEDGETTQFVLDTPLQPGTSYEWYVKAVHAYQIEGGAGYDYGPKSEIRTFTTDGMCSSSDLVAPTPVYPAFGEWFGEGAGPGPASVNIEWSYPGDCYPEYFHYQVASDPEFSNIITAGITAWDEYSAQVFVPRCARVYWRVQGRVGNVSGEYSESSRFTYSSIASCLQNQQSIDTALIKGFVFADYCKSTVPWIPEGVDIWPPCVFGEPHGVHADGNRNRSPAEQETTGEQIPAESGISDVVVDLGSGPCPSSGLDQMITTGNGGYYFMVQSPGVYCLSVSKDNNPALDHGIWTLPLTSDRTTQVTITFEEGQDLILQDIGWDQNDFIKIDFVVDKLSFCRAGDSREHSEIAIVEEGAAIPVFARNEDASWFAALVDGKRCFISIASGAPEEDPEGLLIYPEQPAPIPQEPTPSPGDSQKQPENCAAYNTPESCQAHDCKWIYSAAAGICTTP